MVEFFNRGGEQNPFLGAEMKPLGLTGSEGDDLVNFLSALTSGRFGDQRAACDLYRSAVQRQKGLQ